MQIPAYLQERLLDISSFGYGLHLLEDSTKAPIGSARVMTNMMITDKGGISKRPGTAILGTASGLTNPYLYPTHGIFNYIKSNGAQEIPIKAFAGQLSYFHPTLKAWATLSTGYTSGQEFGFKEHLVNTDNEDYVYFCNRTEPYSRWSGATATTTAGLISGGTALLVDSTLKTDVFEAKTASANSATTLDVANTPWAASMWVNFYVRITSGAHTGKIRLISANTSSQITFATLGGAPGNCTFEIRQIKFPASGTLTVGDFTATYTAVPTDASITIDVNAEDLPGPGGAVTVAPTTYPANPRGNRLETHYTRMVVGNVRSALSRDSGGALQGSNSAGSYYVSKTKNATDFTFSAARVAGEGDIVSTPYGGGDITDVVNMEDQFYVFKARYIEAAKYSQDTSDLITRQQLKTGFGSIYKTIKGRDDIFFITYDNQITSVGRVQLKDTVPQSVNMGLTIKTLLDTLDFSATTGIEYKNRLFITCKSSSSDTVNNRVLVYNERTKSFEGLWELQAYGFMIYLTNLHYGSSQTPDVYQMFTGASDAIGTTSYPISSTWKSNWMNLTPKRRMVPKSDFNLQSVHALAVEGYIRGGTTLTFELASDFIDTPALSFTFGGTETQFLDADNLFVFLGDRPLGSEPLATFTNPDVNGDIHFMFIVYFPDVYSNHFSLAVSNAGTDQYFEITRFGLAVAQDTMFPTSRVKTL